MKHLFSFAAISLFASAAFAWPTVGDTATYGAVVAQAGHSITGTVQLTITAINQSTDQLTAQIVQTVNGKSQSETRVVKYSDMANAANQIPQLLANCAQYGGVPEQVTTSAGAFNTCKLASDDGDSKGFTWYANVVFGWVKQSHTNSQGQATDLVLNTFSAAH